jgi:hypothetical protein
VRVIAILGQVYGAFMGAFAKTALGRGCVKTSSKNVDLKKSMCGATAK